MLRLTRLTAAAFATLLGAAPTRAELPPLIPRKVLFGNPVKASPQISPDGTRLAYLGPAKEPEVRRVLRVFLSCRAAH